jgi:hypothetical protein
MGKYQTLESDIFSVFASAEWVAESIKTYPSNFLAVSPGNEFIRISILPSGGGVNLNSVSGVLIAELFIEGGKGTKRFNILADKLDEYLSGKTLSSGPASTQFLSSSLKVRGKDKDNPALFHASYSIPFNYFGVM